MVRNDLGNDVEYREAPSLLISDLDGTLIDSRKAMSRAIRAGCEAVGTSIDPEDDLNWCNGPRVEDSLRRLVGPSRLLLARAAYRAEYERTGPSLTTVMPGASDALKSFRAIGIKLAIATYRPLPLAELVLQAVGLRENFELVVGRRLENDERSKGLLLREALTELQAQTEEVIYVGDHKEDELAARVAGVRFLRYGTLSWPDICRLVQAQPRHLNM